MLIFNNSGLLVPANKIVSTLAELELEFVTTIPSSTRKEVFENYFKYSEDLKKVCN